MAWVRGVRMGEGTAAGIARAARECGLELTAHAPYFINLCGSAEVARRSLQRLLTAARLGVQCGAQSLCFHVGFYPSGGPGAAIERVARTLRTVTARLRREGVRIDLRPELSGRARQLGTLDEILEWSAAVEGVMPCLDFAHHYARHGGAFNRYQDFAAVLERVRTRLGGGALERLHVHLSGIEYGPTGERRHVPLRQSRFRYREVLRALRDSGVSGWVICESPAMEEDALRLQRAYRRLG